MSAATARDWSIGPKPHGKSNTEVVKPWLNGLELTRRPLVVWRHPGVVVDGQLELTARADDTTVGILHNRFHELWSLRMGTSLEDRPRYTPTTCFETFPFPAGLTPADTAHQRTEEVEGGGCDPVHLR